MCVLSIKVSILRKSGNLFNDPRKPELTNSLFPKIGGCRYETIEEMKEAVTKVIVILTQQDSPGVFQKLLERYNKCIAAGGDYFEGGLEFHVWTSPL